MPHPLKIAYLTAGAGGMFCGSCLHDNTLARALTALGVDVQLIPTYTPIRTDEADASISRVFYGGLNVYFDQNVPGYRWLPRWLTAWLDRPGLIRWAAGRGIETDAKFLGKMAVSMLRGEHGNQRREVRTLCDYLRSERPDVVVLTNALIAGFVVPLRRELNVPVLVTLQGDDIFLNSLPEPFRAEALAEIRQLAEHVSGFLVHSRYYADYMSELLDLPREKMYRAPLGIDTADFVRARPKTQGPPTVGYLARLAPEKGLHVLVDAFLELRRRPEMQTARLRVAGWLGAQNRNYAAEQFQKLASAGLGNAFDHVGEVTRSGKVDFLQSIDVLSVPTTYRDPKGLFVLESLAAGVPVVQPNHGAFSELLAATGGGRLVEPENPLALADVLEVLLRDRAAREVLIAPARATVLDQFNARAMAERTLDVISQAAGIERDRAPAVCTG